MRALSVSSVEVRLIAEESGRTFVVGQRDDETRDESEGQSEEETRESASQLQSSLFQEVTNVVEKTSGGIEVISVNGVIS